MGRSFLTGCAGGAPGADNGYGMRLGMCAESSQARRGCQAKLTEQLGTLPADVMSQLEEGLRAALDLA